MLSFWELNEIIDTIMIKPNFKASFKALFKYKVTSILSILGLSIGLLFSLMIFLLLDFEYSYEENIPQKDFIYRITNEKSFKNGDKKLYTTLAFPLRNVIKNSLTGIEKVCFFNLFDYYGEKTIIPLENGTRKNFLSHGNIVITDEEYFDFFPTRLLAGNYKLDQPDQVVLTIDKAEKYFGKLPTSQYLGKRVIYSDSVELFVSGIISNHPQNTDYNFTDYISRLTAKAGSLKGRYNLESWGNESSFIFLMVSPDASRNLIIRQLNQGLKSNIVDKEHFNNLQLQRLSDIHFSTGINSNFEYPFIKTDRKNMLSLLLIAFFILILSIINVINISISQSFFRRKEIAIRRILGGGKTDIFVQVITETLITTIISLFLSLLLVKIFLYILSDYIPNGVNLNFSRYEFYAYLVLITLFTTLLASIYPAFIISKSNLTNLIKGGQPNKNKGSFYFRKGMIIFQFSVSVVFIICALLISKQMNYVVNKDLGFFTKAIVAIPTGNNSDFNKLLNFTKRLRSVTGVKNSALQAFDPISNVHLDAVLNYSDTYDKDINASVQYGNAAYIDLYGFKLLAGKNFNPGDSNLNEMIANRSFVKALGFKSIPDILGKRVSFSGNSFTIIGILEDFHQNSLYEPIKPLVIVNDLSMESNIAVALDVESLKNKKTEKILSDLKHIWSEYYPEREFFYNSLEQSINSMYAHDNKILRLINYCTFLAVIISCLGLLGISIMAIAVRRKEIAIRKILGSSVANVLLLLNRETFLLISIAFLIGGPLSWYYMQNWLDNFSYHIQFNILLFLEAAIIAFLLGTFTVSIYGIKEAIINPIKNIRS